MIGIKLSIIILTISILVHEYACQLHQSSANIKKRQTECSNSGECGEDQWCVNNICENACGTGMDCESWSKDGYCVAQHNTGTCRFHSRDGIDQITDEGEDEDEGEGEELPAELTQGTKPEGADCSETSECAPHLYCHTNNRCTNPCAKLVICTSSGANNPGFVVAKESGQVRSPKHHCAVRNYVLKCV